MQKSSTRCASTGKVTKKATKKMGTPSPPAKKKKSSETSEATTSTAAAPRAKSPVKKKPTVLAKKAQVARKDLKTVVVVPKQKVQIVKKKIVSPKAAVKRQPAKKVVKAKARTKPEPKATDAEAKVKKMKKSETGEPTKPTTAKNKSTNNSKLSKTDTKSTTTLPTTSETTMKKSGTTKATEQKSKAKSKVVARTNKQKNMKKETVSKVVLSSPVQIQLVPAPVLVAPSQVDNAEASPGDVIKPELTGKDKSIIKERRDTLESDKRQPKKDDKKEEPADKKPVKKDETEEINCKETIAKLLKKANKSITPKKKRDMMKIKSNTTTIVKKAKIIRKPKKPQINVVKTEPEEVKDQEPVDAKKVTKKPAKPKKKPNIKEETVELKEEIKEAADKEAHVDECVKKEEYEQNTDDSTTSDEMTLHLLKQTSDQATTCSRVTDDSSSSKAGKIKKITKVKSEPSSEDSDQKYKPLKQVKRKASPKILQDKKKKMMLLKKAAAAAAAKDTPRSDSDQKGRKLKLYSWWTGPKRHRVASLNALAKVHCLYENESRGALYDVIKRSPVAKESNSDDPEHEPSVEPTVEASTRTLRSVPGLRGVGKHWEMHDETSSSSALSSSEENSNDDSVDGRAKLLTPPPSYKQKQQQQQEKLKVAQDDDDDAEVKEKKDTVKAPRKRRNRTELMMDLKDMVVRKRMASLNASAILAASYSVEKKPLHCVQTSDSSDTDDGSDASVMTDVISDKEPTKRYETDVNVKKEEKVIEVRASPNKKVAVILNQDTDVTITGVYVNSTTRSTHHEGYCSIAGMQYRISATSHTQTAATAVATETLLHSEHGTAGEQSVPCKSYTPLGALSSMQPPGSHVPPPPPPHSPTGGRRHGCPSAFTAPPAYGPPPPHHHHHPPPPGPPGPDQPPPPTYIHGYYQPAGPLITAHHGHSHPPPLPVATGKVVAAAAASLEASPSPTPPLPTTHQPPPSSTGTAESSDNEVIITSASSGGGGAASDPVPVALPLPAQTYRYTTGGQYPPPPPPGYSYSAAAAAAASAAYPPSQYYHHVPPPATYAQQQQQQQQQHYHHDICYPSSAGYPASYIHPKTYTTFRRYLPAPPPPAGPQYYQTNAELYPAPPPSNATSSQVVSAASGAAGSSYQPQPPPPSATLVESYVPPPAPVPPTIVEPYPPPPPPPHYYTGYSTGPAPPACYTHSPPTRNLAFIDAAYQSCPCPMQSCPKNVHTGPLTGDGKRSSVIAKESSGVPLPPVALALPLEPASVAGPPSPARGSAGMPPPPSPAGATYQPTPASTNNNSNSNNIINSSSSCNNISSNSTTTTTTGVPTLTPKWEEDHVVLLDKPTRTECSSGTAAAAAAAAATTTSTAASNPSERRNKARVGKQMARNNIMLLMCHNTNTTAATDNPVKREVESPEETKTLVTSIAVPSTPPPTPSPSPMLLVSETKQESPESLVLADKLLTSEQPQPTLQDVKQQSLKNETYYEEEQQQHVRGMRRHSIQQHHQHQQPKVVNNRRKSIQITPADKVSKELLVKHEHVVLQCTTAAPLDRASVKRKHSITDTTPATDTDDECKAQVKKHKPNNMKSKPVNGSYKDLIKRDKCATKIASDVKPPERKFLLYKTPKIMLGRAKKTVKRKTVTNSDEPTSKRIKTSRPLVASNLHNSKQNKQQQQQQSCETVVVEKKPACARKASVNCKTHRVSNTSDGLTNVDRTIESVVSQCSNDSSSNSVEQQTVTSTTSSSTTTNTSSTHAALRTSNSAGGGVVQGRGVGSGRSGASKRKNKTSTAAGAAMCTAAASAVAIVPRKSLHMPRWSNGWSWHGQPFQGKVFLNSDEALVVRQCYPAMRHAEGDIISPRDCVLLKAGPRKIDLPFVAKVAALWEDEDGEMMMSLLWYYRPEHTDQGRRPADRPDEVFASRHKDTNSVACIEDKCYVLTFNEYCRCRKSVRRLEEGLEHTGQVVPMPEGGTYHRQHRQPPAPLHTAPELVFFCRQVYDFRQKRLMKNPS